MPLAAQGLVPVDPSAALGLWNFNDPSQPGRSLDWMSGTPIVYQGNTAFSASGAGRSGTAGDRAMNFGTAGNSSASVTDPAFIALLNDRNLAVDQLSVVFWQRWSTPVANSSTVWFRSTSASGTNRGFQAHAPWSDGTLYFDTSGCCLSPAQRLTTGSGTNWQQWHHIALIKDRGTKQIWINGQMLASQASGAAPLLGDWTELLLGRMIDSPSANLKGLVDDLGIFSVALSPAQIGALADGADLLSLVVPPAERAPAIQGLIPSDRAVFHPPGGGLGFQAATVSPNSLAPADIRLFLDGVDISDTLVIGGTATLRSATSSFSLAANRVYHARAVVSDQVGRTSARTWTFDTADPATTPPHPTLDLAALAVQAPPQLIDGSVETFVITDNIPGAFIELELGRAIRATRVDLVAPAAPALVGILTGARFLVFGLRDQILYQATLPPLGAGGVWGVLLPPGIDARWLRIDLPTGSTNGLGDHRLALADWRLAGDPSPAVGPLRLAAISTVTQSSTSGGNTAALAIDGNPATASQTQDLASSHWLLTLDRSRQIRRIELTAPDNSFSTRLAGLTLRLLDDASNLLATAIVTHPGPGGVWGFDVPPGTPDARQLWIGLEGGAVNGYGDRVVTLPEVSVLTGTNLALNTPAYMVRHTDSLPAASLANDGNPATFTETTTRTVDGYWETDLGATRTLHSVRIVAFDNGDHQSRLAKATLRLFDENHDSVHSQPLTGTSAVFDLALPWPVNARYLRIGLENKTRTSLTGGIEWWLRLREVQAFGNEPAASGIDGFAADPPDIAAGETTTLRWQMDGLSELTLHPGVGSVGGAVDASGAGSLAVSPSVTTEYLLVGKSRTGIVTRALTVTVGGRLLPPRISEFVASNRFSLRDGDRQEPDWIEIHNPNGTAFDLTNHGLSDNPGSPFKWRFPVGTMIPPHGHRIVFASGNAEALDAGGNLHADFSLAAAGESVVLTAPDSTRLDAVIDYPAQREDLAYGRALDGTIGFLTPTPRGHNIGEVITGWLAPPVFSQGRGFFVRPFILSISHPDPAAELLISLDGREPTTPYSGPITVNASQTIRAAVRRDGFHAPPVETHSYLFHDSVMSSPLMNTTYTQGALASRLRGGLAEIPTISINVPELPDDYIERPASIEIFMPDGSPPRQVNAGLARFGGAWTSFPKKSYRVRFRSEYGARKLEAPLFRGFDKGMPAIESIDTLDLSAGNHDAVDRGFYMANRFVEDTMLEMGSLNPHGRYVHVYLNGTYWGQYNAHERLDDDFLAGYLGGAADDHMVVRGNDNIGDNFINGTPDPQTRESWETVRANRGSYIAVRSRLDVAHLIDFMLVFFYGNCETEFRSAGPVDPGSGFKFWLADADGFLRTSALTLDTTGNVGPGGLFGALVAEGHPDFKILLADRIHRHFFNNGALTPARNLVRLNERMTEIQDSLIAECARWGYRTPANWESAAQTIRTGLFPQRTGNLLGLLRGRGFYPSVEAPVFGQHGGSVPAGHLLPVTTGVGTLHYTLDGSDPRLPGGAVSPTALSAQASSTTFIPPGSIWRYRDVGSLPASNWASPAYNDASWAVGAAPLGYGTGDEATLVSFGSNSSSKFITTYFRKSFPVANPAAVTQLNLDLVRDDGAVVYLNGTEIGRSNMPSGQISFSTLASSTISGNAKLTAHRFSVPPGLLVAGTNVVAVEVHQATANSGDLRFDLSLSQTSSSSIALNDHTRLNARLLSGGTWSALTSADFQVTWPLATAGPYLMGRWDAAEPAGSTPPNLRFVQTDLPDPVLATPLDTPWTLPFNLTSRSRIVGLGGDGVGFINTGNAQAIPGAGFVGGAVVSLDTRGTQDIRVAWTGGTVIPSERDYGIRLQFRVGSAGPFSDVTDGTGNPVEYLRQPLAGHSTIIGPVVLPRSAEDQPLVELRWRYYYRSGSGPRPLLRLDDIEITAGPVLAESLVVVSAPATAQAGRTAPPVVVRVLGRNGATAGDFNGAVTVGVPGLPGLLQGTLTRNAVAGVATFDDLVFPTPGSYPVAAHSTELSEVVHPFPTRVAGLTEWVVPSLIQGDFPENLRRVPHASLLRIDGLLPSATYRYANRIVTAEDEPDADGAGNMIFATGNAGPFVRTSQSPRFLPADLNVRHGEFTTGADGSHTGWFVIEPTGNFRFTPGTIVHPRLILNDGAGGDIPFHFLTAAASAEVTAFGTASGQGSALHGEAPALARDFIVFYSDPDGLTPPLAATPIEDTGAGSPDSWAPFYRTDVAARDGRWGTLIPNHLPAGVRRFEIRDRTTGSILSAITNPDGHDLTTGLAEGDAATGIRLVSEPGFARWQSLRFTLAELADDAVAGPSGDPDADGIGNLLEFVLNGDPRDADRSILPQLAHDGDAWVFTFTRRIESTTGTELLIQHGDDPASWTDLQLDDPQVTLGPVASGLQVVTARLPSSPSHSRFARLRARLIP